MAHIRAEGSAIIDAPAEKVYGIIADYRNAHPNILPRTYFESLDVEAGGYGDGTIIRFRMRAMGSTHEVRARISEPEPGRRLVETALNSPGVTTFIVEPMSGRSRVTIKTGYDRPGVRGWLEQLLVPPLLRKIYAAELDLLATEARKA
jgi:hypothetical protein